MIHKPHSTPVIIQFTIFLDNKVGCLHDLLLLFHNHQLHVMAACLVDHSDVTLARLIFNYPEQARDLLQQNHILFQEQSILAIEIDTESALKQVTACLVQVETNIHYFYNFLIQPNGKPTFALSCEDLDLAGLMLTKNNIQLLDQSDIGR